MLQLDFVLYRFVCDISTFTGLFADDTEGRHIPDVASFHCAWGRTPRARPASTQASSSSGSAPAFRVDGATDNIYFKALGEDMALTFATLQHRLRLDSDHDVITFALRPSHYSASGPLPVVAKGTLDPGPYFDKPKKNYAIKLRDAAGQVTGKLLFSLRVHEIGEEDERGVVLRTASSDAAPSHGNSPNRGQAMMQRNPSRDRLVKTPPQKPFAAPPMETPPSSGRRGRSRSPVAEAQEPPLSQKAPHTVPTPHRSPPRTRGVDDDDAARAVQSGRVVHSVDVQLERVAVKSESIDLDHPAPLLLGGEYNLKIRYGSYTYSTSHATCCNPKEVEYRAQQACITMQPGDKGEKLRFSLWEDKRQVAGFSLDPAKFTADVGEWREYAIPFRYHPTGQRAALDVRVRRLATVIRGSPSHHPRAPSPPPRPAPPASAAVPRQLTYTQYQDPSDGLEGRVSQRHTPLRAANGASNGVHAGEARHAAAHEAASARSSSSPHRTGTSPLDSALVAGGLQQPPPSSSSSRHAYRTSTPLHGYVALADGGQELVPGYRGARAVEASGVRGGWERTPVRQRPAPLTANLADLPAGRRQPDDHEKYIAKVMARLERQQRGPRQQTSLMEEWLDWRDDRDRSRCNSVAGGPLRSPSVSSVASRADSIASVVSRRASAPRATKSNVEHSIMAPFTPDASAYRRRRTSPSPAARNPLIW